MRGRHSQANGTYEGKGLTASSPGPTLRPHMTATSPEPWPAGTEGPADGTGAAGAITAPRGAGPRLLGLEPYAIVFLASAVTLILEILAARILAPHIGVSVYTWTSIIGVILAGISIGNWVGGMLADRWGSRTMLGLIFMAGAAATALVPALANWLPNIISPLPILFRIVLLTLLLFFLPSFILATVSPIVIKLTLRSLEKTGEVAGRIYAVSTAGAILGTFLTGFVLVQTFGSRATVYGLAIILVLLGLVAGRLWRSPRTLLTGLALIMAAGIAASFSNPLKSLCLRESNYFCIRVLDKQVEGYQVKELVLDQLVHSYIKVGDPTHLEYGYQKLFAETVAAYASARPDFRALFIGGGGYEMPRYLEEVYPQSVIEVMEIDPAVTAAAHDFLDFRPDTRVVSFNEDARMRLPEQPKGQYDIVVGDAFNDVSVPWHLTTTEFAAQVKSLLREDGIYAMNIVDAPKQGRFLRAIVRTLQDNWPHVYVMNQSGDLDFDQRSTTVVMASDRELDEVSIRIGAVRKLDVTPITRIVPQSDMQKWLDAQPPTVLRDDFAPVDNYLAPLYLKSR